MHSGLHQAQLENCPTFSFRISSKRETSLYEVKFNLREQPAFQRRFKPREGEVRASYNPLPGGSA